MKNLKTIVLSLFAVVSATEITYPIFGTRRREAYVMGSESKKNQQAAYAAGLSEGGDQGSQFLDQDSNNSYGQDSDDNDSSMANQSLSRGSFGSFLTPEQKAAIKNKVANLSPEEKAALRDKVQAKLKNSRFAAYNKNNDEVAIQSLEDNDDSIDQALQDAGLYDDYEIEIQSLESETMAEPVQAAPVVAENTVEPMVAPIESTESHNAEPTVNSHEEATSTEEHSMPAQKDTEQPIAAPATQEIIEQVAATPIVEKVAEVQTPVVTVTKQASEENKEENKNTQERPVYDAMYTIVHSIYNTAQDMFNYVYNFITEKLNNRSKTKDSEVKVQRYQVSEDGARTTSYMYN